MGPICPPPASDPSTERVKNEAKPAQAKQLQIINKINNENKWVWTAKGQNLTSGGQKLNQGSSNQLTQIGVSTCRRLYKLKLNQRQHSYVNCFDKKIGLKHSYSTEEGNHGRPVWSKPD